MKLVRSFLAANLIFSLVFVSFLSLTVQNVSAQSSNAALQRGFRTGYSDGYMSGYRDVIGNATKSYERHSEYAQADRAFNEDYGSREDYRDGYQQGFETGYDAGFAKQSFDAALPAGLTKRGVKTVSVAKSEPLPPVTNTAIIEPVVEDTTAETQAEDASENNIGEVTYEPQITPDATVSSNTSVEQVAVENTPIPRTKNSPVLNKKVKYEPTVAGSEDIIVIPTETELIIELDDEITTERAREGDAFKARVVSPTEIAGAVIEGRVVKIQAPGRLKRRSELLLSFDRIILTDSRWSNFNASVVEVLPIKGDNVKRVDDEGTVEGKRRYKTDAATIGGSTGGGMLIGGLIGGPVGVAVGAGVGAAFGVGVIVIERGKHINLKDNQELRIRTNYETQIR